MSMSGHTKVYVLREDSSSPKVKVGRIVTEDSTGREVEVYELRRLRKGQPPGTSLGVCVGVS